MKRLLMAFAATAVLAACGSAKADDREVASLSTTPAADAPTGTGTGDTSVTETTGVVDPSEAPLQFAKCMREHGIDMPDPQVSDGGGVLVAIGGPGQDGKDGPDPKEMEAANKDCQHFLEDAAAGFNPPSEADQKKMQEEALAFSKCMRDHGVDMPDPQFGDGGTFSISVGAGPSGTGPSTNGPSLDVDSAEFKDANEACGGPGGGGFAFSTGTVAP
jgi:hypothetical protein